MSIDLANQLETLGTSLQPADDQQQAKVRELVEHYARDEQDQALLLDVLGFTDPPEPPHPARGTDGVRICGHPMCHGQDMCGRNHLHSGPHRSQTVMAAARLRSASRDRRSPRKADGQHV